MRGRFLFYISSFLACAVMAVTSGCASGGFYVTRKWAQIVNSQMVIIRVILYIISLPIFGITLLIDYVLFNTVDFWQGKLSAGDYHFKGEGKTYVVRHEYLPGSKLRRSTIHVSDADNKPLQDVVLTETKSGEIEVNVDGKLRGRIHDIKEFPVATVYDKNGKILEDNLPISVPPMLVANGVM